MAGRGVEHRRRLGVSHQHDLVAVLPFADSERAAADRVVADLAGIGLDRFARDHAACRSRKVKQEIVVRRRQLDAQGVAVDRLQAVDDAVVTEVVVERFVARDLAFEQAQPRRLDHRVVQPLEAIDVIRGRHFAPCSLEGRIGRKKNAGANFEGIGQAAIPDFRHAVNRVFAQLHGPGQVNVAQQRVEQVLEQAERGDVGSDRRIEPGFARRQEHVQHFTAGGGRSSGRNGLGRTEPERGEQEHGSGGFAGFHIESEGWAMAMICEAGAIRAENIVGNVPRRRITFLHGDNAYFHHFGTCCAYTLAAQSCWSSRK